MVYVIQICLQLASRIRMEPACERDQDGTGSVLFIVHTAMAYVSKFVWHIPLLCVQWKTPDDGQRNCPKHVEFYSKNENKFEKLVHLVGFIIRSAYWHILICDCYWTWLTICMGLFVITMEVVCGIQWPLVSPQDFSTAKSGKKKNL